MKHLLPTVAVLSLAVPALAQEATPPPSPGEIAAAAPARDWVAIAPSDLLVMDLAPDAKSRPRRVVIQLMPAPFSQGWIGNVRKLAAAHWWDGTSVNRVQDNYVAQWGDATEKKPLPQGLAALSEDAYSLALDGITYWENPKTNAMRLKAVWLSPEAFEGGPIIRDDSYADAGMFWKGWPVAMAGDAKADEIFDRGKYVWPVHCYGMVGVGRNMSPDTGSGAELYAVIGHAPRHLDRNIAVVGRVVSGIEYLSSLPRGTEELGFYKTEAERTPIGSIRIASDLPAAEQPRFEYLSTESDSFARYADARANRRDPFFIKPAGGADICNIPVPVRPVVAK
ncbi:peptidylprolyl isomerase [Sphingopyxis sp.]|uniref:peptidylprolyl isomerase n=1 Tax=Sphingopyxis sp. TaxID=1908224 RepID=UPI002DF02A96|nr:peptidylprolyl isomerase [Sphingopyxis sp.]